MGAFPGSVADKGFSLEKRAKGWGGRRNPGLRKEAEVARRKARERVARRAEDARGREIRETITAYFSTRVFGIYCTQGRICEPLLMASVRAACGEERRKRAEERVRVRLTM